MVLGNDCIGGCLPQISNSLYKKLTLDHIGTLDPLGNRHGIDCKDVYEQAVIQLSCSVVCSGNAECPKVSGQATSDFVRKQPLNPRS